jgi:glycosyltransferase involved in cell wall biosynthesis
VTESRLRVAFLIDSLASGGAQRQAVEIACWLAARGVVAPQFVAYHAVDFFGPRLRAAGVPVTVLPKRARIDPTLPMRLRRWLVREEIDVLHAFLPPSCLYGYLATRAIPKARRPLFVAAERSELRGASSRGLWIERLVYPRSDAVTANAESVAREIESRIKVDPSKLHYIPNGIDIAAWDRAAAGECPIAIDPSRFHLALVGGLRREKNHQVLMEALSLLAPEERAGLSVWFIGGETGAPGMAASIRDQIAQLGLAPIIRIVPATPHIAAIMRRLDALVLPSAFEGFPNALLEAMTSSLPAIASRVGDVPNLLEDGRTGFLVAPGDASGLAAALRRLRGLAPEDRLAMGARARQVVEERFRMELVAARYLALYESLVSVRAGAAGDGAAAAVS